MILLDRRNCLENRRRKINNKMFTHEYFSVMMTPPLCWAANMTIEKYLPLRPLPVNPDLKIVL